MEDQKDIIVADRLGIVRTDCEKRSIWLICSVWEERAVIVSTDVILNCMPETYPSSVERKMLEKIEPSDDFRCKIKSTPLPVS